MKVETKPLILRDEIHGDMAFDSFLREVVDHRGFQRLRHIKQLGLAEYVFPCASHTRFQHSLGASYLAGQYFSALLNVWLGSPFQHDGTCEKTKFLASKTENVIKMVADDRHSAEFWHRTVSLAALLHDVGHGPWSHTFEYLDLKQDFSKVTRALPGAVGKYFDELIEKKQALMHEDISLLYIFHILNDLSETKRVPNALRYFLSVTLLVNKKLATGKYKKALEQELADGLKKFDVKGGVDMHWLLRPLISGPFDVDRIDYIQRDGRNCGVNIGGIEWRRIVTKVIPCLAEHSGEKGEPSEVILISNTKNHHVLDDFTFSLFQMYAQVYMHPKIVGLEEILRRLLVNRVRTSKNPTITFDLHQSLSDEKFREMLKEDFKIPEIEDLLFRQPEANFQVISVPNDSSMKAELERNKFEPVQSLDRPMMKDSVGVFLFSHYRHQKNRRYVVQPWVKVSPIAKQTFAIHYSPSIWINSNIGVDA